jgi:hypothetical protein
MHKVSNMKHTAGAGWWTLTLTFKVRVDVHDGDSTGVTHTFLSNAQNLIIVFAEFDSLHSSLEFPSLETFAGLNIPQSSRVIGRSSNSHSAGG